MSSWRAVAVAVVVGLLAATLPSVAWAGSADDPELTDACGVAEEAGSDLVPVPPAPWTDICSAWFETLTGAGGPPAVKVSMELAGPVAQRPAPSGYYLSWRVDGCLYMVEHADAGTSTGEIRELRYRCGPAYQDVPCDPPWPLGTCSEALPVERVPLPAEAFTFDGNVVSVTLIFAEGLGHHSGDFSTGSALESLYARASGTMPAGSYCVGSDCGATNGDTASGGRAYAVEPGSGAGPDGPVVPALPSCLDGSVDSASAANPHVTDPEGDMSRNAVRHPDAEGPGYDLRALWFTRAEDGVDLHILPAGPADPVTTGYWTYLGTTVVRVEGQPDGTWSASVYEETGTPNLDYPGASVAVTVDDATGEVVATLPRTLLPAGEVLRIDRFNSHYIVAGQARPHDSNVVMQSVDDDAGARICEATLA